MALIDHLDGDRMVFTSPLIQARILRRPNRFLMDVELEDGSTAVAHCPSTGSIGGISLDGLPCLLSGPHDLAHRRTEYTVDALGNDGLTDAERQEYADRYARGPGRGMDERTRRTIAKIRQRRNPPAV